MSQALNNIPTTGPEAIAAAIATYSIDDIEKEATDILRSGKKSARGRAVKLLRYVKGFRRNKLKPSDYIIKNVPVIPPKFRPFNVIGDAFVPGAANELYRDLFSVMDAHKDVSNTFGNELSGDSKLNVYDSVKAVYGFGKPVLPKTRYRGVSGFLQQVIGNNSKFSFFQRKAVSKPVDFTSRGVIGVDPDLDLDQIGVPKDMAFKIYSPYIQRELVRRGISRHKSLKAVVDQTPEAKAALESIIQDRPIVYSRAPAWHKYNVTAGYPKLIDGDTILISPLVTTGHNADFDGDTMNLHVPSLPEAVDDAKEKLMPSKMLFSIKERNKVVPSPTQELILGLYTAQHRPARAKHIFKNEEEVLQGIEKGTVKLSDEITIKP
jgi:DNA-directed RNA polymerase subunit beta'